MSSLLAPLSPSPLPFPPSVDVRATRRAKRARLAVNERAAPSVAAFTHQVIIQFVQSVHSPLYPLPLTPKKGARPARGQLSALRLMGRGLAL